MRTRHGTGYAIEFSWAKLRNKFYANRLGKVAYSAKAQNEIVNHVLKFLASKYQHKYTDEDALFSIVASEFTNALLPLRAFLKSPAFREEREWRIISFPGADNHKESYRISGDLLIPYCELPLGTPDDLPITKIIVGPSLNPKGAESSLRRFLDSIGLVSVGIEASPIPLRV